ncbi:MAG: HAMP domain-containing sensor histidine kinase, partial [Sedimentibacter sp.]
MKSKNKKKIRTEILIVFAVCVVVSVIAGRIAFFVVELKNDNINSRQIYVVRNLNSPAVSLSREIEQKNIDINDAEQIQEIMVNFKGTYEKVIISDSVGKVLYSTDNSAAVRVNINDTVKDFIDMVMGENTRNSIHKYNNYYTSFYPVQFNDAEGYVIINNKISREIFFNDEFISDSTLISIFVTFITFVTMFILLTNKKIKYIEYMSAGLLEISKGNLNYKIPVKGDDELSLLAANINLMTDELKKQIDIERNSEKIKNELITNVSHDLKTPLTSIKGYLEIIKNKKHCSENEVEQYISIIYNKSEKLENLINDLFEYTKLTNSTVSLNYQSIDLNQLLSQLIEEFVPVTNANNVTISKEFLNEKTILNLDPDKTARIFENLLTNAIKYS